MSDALTKPTILNIGLLADGPAPVVVITDENLTAPVGYAYLDLAEHTDDSPGPKQLDRFPIPLEPDDNGEYILGDPWPAGRKKSKTVPTPALHQLPISDESIAEGLGPLVGNLFCGERLEIHVPTGTHVDADALDFPLYLKGEFKDIGLFSGGLVCLDLNAERLAPDIEIWDVDCVYGIVPTSGQTQFINVDELRVRVDTAPEVRDDLSIEVSDAESGRAVVLIAGTNFLELECGTDIDAVVTKKVTAAHIVLAGSAEVHMASAEVLRFGNGPVYGHDSGFRQSDIVVGGRAYLDGTYGLLVNDSGPAMHVRGTVKDLTVVGEPPWLNLDWATIQESAEVQLFNMSDGATQPPVSLVHLNAAPGCVPLLIGGGRSLTPSGSWRRLRHDDARTPLMRLRYFEIIEENVWALAPSAKYEAKRQAAELDVPADLTVDPLEPPAPGRVRKPVIEPDGFGSDPLGDFSQQGHLRRDVGDITPRHLGPEGRGLDFGSLD